MYTPIPLEYVNTLKKNTFQKNWLPCKWRGAYSCYLKRNQWKQAFLKNSVCTYEVTVSPNGGKHRCWLELWKPNI